jgi:excisionase family DNA binding protein
MFQESRYLTVNQVQKFLGLKRSRIYYLTSTGRIPFIRLGKTLLFDAQDLHQWIDSMKVKYES